MYSKYGDYATSVPESYTSNDPWSAEGVQVTGVAVRGLLPLGSISVFTPTLCVGLPVLADA